MNRLQKKCLIVSVTLHLLLLGVVLFGSALVPAPKTPPIQPLTMIDPRLISDAPTSGVNPAPGAAAPAQAPAPRPAVEPPRPRVEQPEIPKTQEPPKTKTSPEKDVEPPKPAKPRVVLNSDELKMNKRPTSKPTTTKTTTDAPDDSQARADAVRRSQITKQIGQSVKNLNGGLSTATTVETTFGGGGESGPAAQNYRDVVASIYTAAWTPPADLDDELATVSVSVTIARDGNVVTGHITKSSGNPAMDRSIQATLEKVTYIAPFPPGAKEPERIYRIKFNLQVKRSIG
jgi:TonB family protein